MSKLALLLFVLPLLLAPAAASGDGGPSPGAVNGGEGVLGAHGAVRYVAVAMGQSTAVEAIEVHGGRVLDYRIVRGGYGIPLVANDGSTGGLSADGSALVLASFNGPFQPGQVSLFSIVSPAQHLKEMRRIALPGMFSYDAISPHGRFVYLIQYAQTGSTVTYRVRAFDVLRRRLLRGSIVDRREPDEKMQGSPVTRATSRDGGWAYTLYARGSGKAFVHALDTRGRAAFCIDLPFTGAQQALNGLRMTVEEGRLLVREGTDRIASVDRKSFAVKSYRAP